MSHYITLANGKQIPLGIYVTGIKKAISNPHAEFPYGLTTWWPTTGHEIRKQFMGSIMDRIGQGISYSKRGL